MTTTDSPCPRLSTDASASTPHSALARLLTLGYYLGLFPALAFGGLTGHIARLAGHPRPWLPMAALACLAWLSYLLDRLFAGPEDAGEAGHNAAAFARRHRRMMVGLVGVAAGGLLILSALDIRVLVVSVAGLPLAGAYFLRLPGLGRRIKDVPYAKGVYGALLVLALAHAYVGCGLTAAGGAWELLAWLLLYSGYVIYDLKDAEADRETGVRTLATRLDRAPFLLVVGGGTLACVLACQLLGIAALGLAMCFAVQSFAAVYLARAPFDARTCGAIDGVQAAFFLLTLPLI